MMPSQSVHLVVAEWQDEHRDHSIDRPDEQWNTCAVPRSLSPEDRQPVAA